MAKNVNPEVWGPNGALVAANILPSYIVVGKGGVHGGRGRKRKQTLLPTSETGFVARDVGGGPVVYSHDSGPYYKGTHAYYAGDEQTLDSLVKQVKTIAEKSEEYKNDPLFRNIRTPGDLVHFVFDKSKGFHPEDDAFSCPSDCHIARIEYSDTWMLLRVTFSNDATMVVYSDVPRTIFDMLKSCGDKRGWGVDRKEHSLVGIKFWDYVRVRGSRHLNRYRMTHLGVSPDASPSSRGYGGASDAARGAANRSVARADGNSAEQGKARAAKQYRPFSFFGEELTPKMKREIKKAAGPNANKEGTIAFELVHGNMDKAKALAEDFKKAFIDSGRTSPSIKNKLKEIAESPRNESHEALLYMENLMISLGQWPLTQ